MDVEELTAAVPKADEANKVLKAANAALQAKIEQLQADIAKMKGGEAEADGGKDDDVLKGLSPEARQVVEKALAEAREAREAVAKLHAKEREQEFIARAKELKNLPTAPDKLGPILKACADALPAEQYGELTQLLKAANDSFATILKISGSGVPAAGTAEAELEGIAKGIRDKRPNLTFEQAYTIALEENPDLYKRLLAEKAAA